MKPKGHQSWGYSGLSVLGCELSKAPFEEITFLQEECALKERLNNYEAFNFKGTQVHASTAGDWLIEALFALTGISIALCQGIQKEK